MGTCGYVSPAADESTAREGVWEPQDEFDFQCC
jgi:hypothetical protein